MAVFRITCTCLVDGQTCQNVLHFEHTGGITVFTMPDTIALNWLDQISQFQHSSALWTQIEARQVDPAGGLSFSKAVSVPGAGPPEGDQDNSMLARVIQLRSNTPGKHGRGRFYIPGTSNQAWSKGIIKASSLTAGNPLIANLEARFIGATPSTGLRLIIARRNDPGNFVAVTKLVQRGVVGVQRRRQIGVGI